MVMTEDEVWDAGDMGCGELVLALRMRLKGMPGQLRFVYETLDSCCGFERGWYIDDLSFAAFCDDEAFPPA